MGEDVDAQEFSRADRTRYREKVHRCLDVFERMLSEDLFHTDDPMTGLEVELNLVDDAGDPALKNAEVLEAIADPAFQTELGQFNIEINVPPAWLREGGLGTFEASLRRSLNDAESRSAEVGAHQVMIGVLPTLAPGPLRPADDERQPALPAAERADPPRPRRGHPDRHHRPRAADHHRGLDPARGGLHQHPVPRADLARAVRGVLERLAGDLLGPARGGRQLAVLPGQGAVARDPDPALRAGRGHPQRGAEVAGGAAAGVVRRAVDQLGLRPLRGERPLLPGAAADHHRRGPGGRARGGGDPAARASSGSTTAPSTAGTGRSTTSTTAPRTCASRTACCRPARRSPT